MHAYIGIDQPIRRDRTAIEPQAIINALETAVRYSERVPTEWMHFFLQGYTQHHNLEYNQAFITAWTIVEQYIGMKWKAYIGNLPRKRKRKFASPGYWSTDHSMEILSLSRLLDAAEYDQVSKFKLSRNKLVHEMASITEEESDAIIVYVRGVFGRLAEQ